ncbi:hypothetical protein V3481_002023 [Fusarium oxysporum f. sp. vasinfectum]
MNRACHTVSALRGTVTVTLSPRQLLHFKRSFTFKAGSVLQPPRSTRSSHHIIPFYIQALTWAPLRHAHHQRNHASEYTALHGMSQATLIHRTRVYFREGYIFV